MGQGGVVSKGGVGTCGGSGSVLCGGGNAEAFEASLDSPPQSLSLRLLRFPSVCARAHTYTKSRKHNEKRMHASLNLRCLLQTVEGEGEREKECGDASRHTREGQGEVEDHEDACDKAKDQAADGSKRRERDKVRPRMREGQGTR